MSTAELLPVDERRIVEIDGYLVDDDTGEVVGMAELRDEPFRICDDKSADWVLSKLADAESAIVGYEALKKALVANVDRKIAVERRRADFLRYRFGAELEEHARAQLAGGKKKTLQLPHGSIAFRTSKGTNKITDMERAVSWLHEHGHSEKVKIEEYVTITDLLAALADTDRDTITFLESTGARETVTIKTGVGD